jgi:hypothetical protein
MSGCFTRERQAIARFSSWVTGNTVHVDGGSRDARRRDITPRQVTLSIGGAKILEAAVDPICARCRQRPRSHRVL